MIYVFSEYSEFGDILSKVHGDYEQLLKLKMLNIFTYLCISIFLLEILKCVSGSPTTNLVSEDLNITPYLIHFEACHIRIITTQGSTATFFQTFIPIVHSNYKSGSRINSSAYSSDEMSSIAIYLLRYTCVTQFALLPQHMTRSEFQETIIFKL